VFSMRPTIHRYMTRVRRLCCSCAMWFVLCLANLKFLGSETQTPGFELKVCSFTIKWNHVVIGEFKSQVVKSFMQRLTVFYLKCILQARLKSSANVTKLGSHVLLQKRQLRIGRSETLDAELDQLQLL